MLVVSFFFFLISSSDSNVQPVLKLLLCTTVILNLGNFAPRVYLAISGNIFDLHPNLDWRILPVSNGWELGFMGGVCHSES